MAMIGSLSICAWKVLLIPLRMRRWKPCAKPGKLPDEKPFWEGDGFKLFTDDRNAENLKKAAGNQNSLVGFLRAHLQQLAPGDYFALLAYIQMNFDHETRLQAMRHAVRDRRRNATCLGFGPRFLHSTGQAYKGGP